MNRLDGRVALVTGASSGIGEATALTLATSGASVVLVARRADRLNDLREQIESKGGRALAIEADVKDETQARAAVQRAVDEFGSLDIVVNNAGQMLLGPVENAPVEEWEAMIDLNLKGLLYVAHASLPHLLKAGENGVADIVNISSVAGRVARNGSGVYNLTKFGVGAFSESLRQEVTKRNVRVSLIEPGAVDTELAGHNRPEVLEGLESRLKNMERLTAQDIADAIEYVVSRPRRVAVNELLIRPTDQEF